jgi:hypothetical protein
VIPTAVCLLVAVVSPWIPDAAAAGSLAEMYRAGTVQLDLSLELGGDEVGDEDAIIFAPSGFALDSAGYIYIAAYKLHCIKKFDPAGHHLLTFGREGEGPGEFFGVGAIAIDRDDRIITHDFQNKRFQTFTNGGAYLASYSMQDQVNGIVAASGGGLYVGTTEFNYMDPTGENTLRLSWMSDDFGRVTTIDSTRIRMWEMVRVGDGVQMATLPFRPYQYWAVSPGGNIIVGRSDEYRLDILSPEYEKVGEITRDVEAPAVTERDKTDYLARFERDGRSGLSPAMKDKMDFPGRKPYFDDIVVDWDGNILVRWTERTGNGVAVYDAFDPAGSFIGRVEIEGLSAGAVFRDGFVYTRYRAEDALPTVRRYRIPGVSAAAGKP